jgi:hypothetical protein
MPFDSAGLPIARVDLLEASRYQSGRLMVAAGNRFKRRAMGEGLVDFPGEFFYSGILLLAQLRPDLRG